MLCSVVCNVLISLDGCLMRSHYGIIPSSPEQSHVRISAFTILHSRGYLHAELSGSCIFLGRISCDFPLG